MPQYLIEIKTKQTKRQNTITTQNQQTAQQWANKQAQQLQLTNPRIIITPIITNENTK